MSKDYAAVVSEENVKRVQKTLEANGFNIKIVDTLDQARDTVLAEIPEGSEVYTATSVTLDDTGLTKVLNDSGRYISLRNKFMPLAANPETKLEARRVGSVSEYALGSVHAITEDGQVLVASATGSQLPNYVYGANHVIWVVGTQKIVKDLNEAMDRLERHTFPLENERSKQAYGVPSVISKLLIYRKDPQKRVTIVLVRQPVGY